jgi:hypothetical protein
MSLEVDTTQRVKAPQGETKMMAANYPTKKALKAAIDQMLRYQETSFFGPEYRENGSFAVVGPSPTERKWYATVMMESGLIKSVR